MTEVAMGWSGWLAAGAMLLAAIFLVRYVGANLSLAGTTLGLFLLFHGPAYLYYTRVWGPDTDFYDHILAAAPGQPVIRNLDLAIGSLFLFLFLGVRFADVCWRENRQSMRRAIVAWGATAARVSVSEASRLRFWLVFIGFGVLVPFLFIDNQLSKVVDYFSIDLSAQDKIDLRREEGGSAYYLYNVLISTFAPFLSFCVVAARRQAGRNWKVLGIAFVGLLSVAKMAMLSKAPLAVFIVQLVVICMLCKSLQVRPGAAVGVTATAVVGFAVMAVIAIPSLDGLEVLANFLFYRVFMIVNESLLEYFAAIPYVLHFSWGAKMGWVASLFQGDAGLPNYWLVAQVHRGMIASTTSAMFLGDAWADWSWLGVILYPFAMGFLMRGIDIKLIAHRGKSIGAIAALGLGHFAIFIALTRSLQTMVITGGLLFVVFFCWLIGGAQDRRDFLPSARGIA